jgi:hypothetical protein
MKPCDKCGCSQCECKKREELRKSYLVVINDQISELNTFKLKKVMEAIERIS